MLKSRNIYVLACLLYLVSCGNDDGGGSTPTNPDQEFSLAQLNSLTTGNVYKSNLVGNITGYGSNPALEGDIAVVNNAQVSQGGVMVTPRVITVNLKGIGTTKNFTVTRNYGIDGHVVSGSTDFMGTAVTCTADVPEKLPDTIKLDDQGLLSTMTCDNGMTLSGSWRADNAGSNNILLVETTVLKNSTGETQLNTQNAIKINNNGSIVSISVTSDATYNDQPYTLKFWSL